MHPQVIVTEMFPFGRRAFRGELSPVLQAARSLPRRPLVIASVRDILVSKRDPSRYDFMVQTCLEHYDQVLVHGDERLLPFASSFPPAAELGSRIVHTGFVHQRAQALERGAGAGGSDQCRRRCCRPGAACRRAGGKAVDALRDGALAAGRRPEPADRRLRGAPGMPSIRLLARALSLRLTRVDGPMRGFGLASGLQFGR